jgi:Obg family GTPase CgtA-like protein
MDKKSLSSLGKTALPVNKIVAAVAILAGVVLLLSWIIPSLSEKDAAPTTESAAQPERQAVALAPTTSAATAIPDGVVPVSGALPVDVTQEGIVSGANGVGIDAEQAEEEIESHVLYKFEREQPFTVSRDGNVWIVRGKEVEKMLRMTSFRTDEAANRFANKLRKMGIDAKLKELGANEGDTIRILDLDFEYKD